LTTRYRLAMNIKTVGKIWFAGVVAQLKPLKQLQKIHFLAEKLVWVTANCNCN